MRNPGILIEDLPELEKPLLIAGFDGWGNALDVSKGMISYLNAKLKSEKFAKLDPDIFYRYDQARPYVKIHKGIVKKIWPPGGSFYAARTESGQRDLVLLKAHEPNLCWNYFAQELFSLCEKLGVETVITIGSMYDNVLHSDFVISGFASSEKLFDQLNPKNINPIYYQGPSAIHSMLHMEGKNRDFQCISLWCHCPYYLQGTTHFGILLHLAGLLTSLGEFQLDTSELEENWQKLIDKIQKLIDNNPKLQDIISDLRKSKIKGIEAKRKASRSKDEKVINLKDFLEPD